MHRFFVPSENISDVQAVLDSEQAHQISQVLRMKVGDGLIILDNSGWEYEVSLTAVSRKRVTGTIVEKRKVLAEPSIHITLYMSLLKRDKFEWVLQKCTEVGVGRFVPLVTQRSLVQSIDIKQSKKTRWQKIIQEAAEQSGRGRLPELCQPMEFAVAANGVETAVALIPWEEATAVSTRQALAGKSPESIALFIGPEGGFAKAEISLAEENGIMPVTLGKRILRSETAAVVAASIIIYDHDEPAAGYG